MRAAVATPVCHLVGDLWMTNSSQTHSKAPGLSGVEITTFSQVKSHKFKERTCLAMLVLLTQCVFLGQIALKMT